MIQRTPVIADAPGGRKRFARVQNSGLRENKLFFPKHMK